MITKGVPRYVIYDESFLGSDDSESTLERETEAVW